MEYVAEVCSASEMMKSSGGLIVYHSAYQSADETDYLHFAADIDYGWSYVREVASDTQEDFYRSKCEDKIYRRK